MVSLCQSLLEPLTGKFLTRAIKLTRRMEQSKQLYKVLKAYYSACIISDITFINNRIHKKAYY